MAETVACEHFFDGARLHGPKRLTVVDGSITAIDDHSGSTDHHLVSPGFVDLQMNGWGDVDVATASTDDLRRLGRMLQDRGTTSWLGTIVTAPLDDMESTASRLARSMSEGVPGMVGMHLEGPFLGGAPGAHRRKHIVAPDPAWLDRLPPEVRLVTLAAEGAGAPDAISVLASRGVVASIGHSKPSRPEFDAAIAAGATMVTHLFNGMSGVHHRDGGLALWTLADGAVNYGLISDMVHVAPEIVSLAFKADAGHRACLVSDSVAWESPWAVSMGVRVADGAPRLPDGTLAGSSSCLADCVRLAVTVAGVGLESALAAATSVPARVLGMPTLGRLGVGPHHGMACLDASLHVVDTLPRLQSARA